jgi:hypothetical protein
MRRDSPDLNTVVWSEYTQDVARDADAEGRDERAEKILSGQLNPDWVEWLMGWPTGWTSLEPLPEGTLEEWQRGGWWDSDPSEDGRGVPRVTTVRTNRVSRLKAIGNGQVPATMATAFQILLERSKR